MNDEEREEKDGERINEVETYHACQIRRRHRTRSRTIRPWASPIIMPHDLAPPAPRIEREGCNSEEYYNNEFVLTCIGRKGPYSVFSSLSVDASLIC
jgi:hypothetical protein